MNNPAPPNGLDSRPFRLLGEPGVSKKFFAENRAQPIDKSRFGRENPRKSKLWGDREGHTANYVNNVANRAARGRVDVLLLYDRCFAMNTRANMLLIVDP